MRYGENPHQNAVFYVDPANRKPGISSALQLQGKELSYNNLLDIDAAVGLIKDFEDTCFAVLKHNNACGCATRETLADIFALFKIRSVILTSLGFSAWVFLVFRLAGWMPALFMRQYELNAAKAGSITGLIYVLGAIGGVVGGIMSDRWQKRNKQGRFLFALIFIVCGTVTKLILFLSFGSVLKLVVVLAIIDAFISNLATPAYFAITQDVMAPK